MAKALTLTGDDLTPSRTRPQSATRQRGEVPSASLIPLQFRMTPAFVRQFKQEALNRDLKLNELLDEVFQHFMKTNKS